MKNYLWLLLSFLLFTACPPRKTLPEAPNDLPDQPLGEVAGDALFAHWKHYPLHPGNRAPVHFIVKVSDAQKVVKVELAVFEYELFKNESGLPSKRKRPNGIWGTIDKVEPDVPRVNFEHSFTFSDGFPAHSNVEYVFTVYALDGTVTRRMALFDAGDSPWPEDKILLYATSREVLKDKINLCFFPDTDYNKDWPLFLNDTEALIFSGYHSNNKIADHKNHWAFYYTRQETDGQALSKDPFNPDRYPDFMKDSLIMGIDAFGLLHRKTYSDGAYINSNIQFLAQSVFTSEAYNWGTAIHETAHIVFHLSDEYSGCHCFGSSGESNVFKDRTACESFNIGLGYPAEDCTEISDYDGQLWYLPEKPPLFATEEACKAYNRQNGLPADSCRLFQDITGVRSFQAFKGICIMQDDGDTEVPAFRHACSAVIDQFYKKLYPENVEAGTWVLAEAVDNFFGYQPVMVFSVVYDGREVGVELKEICYGVATKNILAATDLHLQVQGDKNSYQVSLDRPDCVHIHHGQKAVDLRIAQYAVASNIVIPLIADMDYILCRNEIAGKREEEKVFKMRKEIQKMTRIFKKEQK